MDGWTTIHIIYVNQPYNNGKKKQPNVLPTLMITKNLMCISCILKNNNKNQETLLSWMKM